MNINEFCKEHNLTIDQFYGKEVIKGNLWLSSLTEIPKGFNPIVGSNLNLNSLTKLPNNFNPIVGGTLNLYLLTKLPKGFNPIVGDTLWLNSLNKLPNNFNPIVGGNLNLYSLTKLPNNFNPIVGGNLYLDSLKKLPKGFNPIVGGDLYLYSRIELPNKFKPKCKKIFYNEYNSEKELNTNPNYIIFNNYIKTDKLYKIIEENGNQYKVQELNSDKIFYIIIDDTNYGQSEYLVDALINLKNKSLNQ